VSCNKQTNWLNFKQDVSNNITFSCPIPVQFSFELPILAMNRCATNFSNVGSLLPGPKEHYNVGVKVKKRCEKIRWIAVFLATARRVML